MRRLCQIKHSPYSLGSLKATMDEFSYCGSTMIILWLKLTFLGDPDHLRVGQVEHVHPVDGEQDVPNTEEVNR